MPATSPWNKSYDLRGWSILDTLSGLRDFSGDKSASYYGKSPNLTHWSRALH